MSSGVVRVGHVRWWLGACTDPDRARALLERALAARAKGAANLRPGSRRKELYALALCGAEPDHLLKVQRAGGFLRAWRRSHARRELSIARELADRDVATVVPVAAGEERRLGRLRVGYLLVPLRAGAEDLERRGRSDAAPAERRGWASGLGAAVRRLHDEGLDQEDLAPNNFLVEASGPTLAIDFERARLGAPLAARSRRVALARLERNVGRPSATQRLRFLRAYAGGDEVAARRWWREVEPLARRLAGRDAERWQRVATRDGRRFHRLALAGWSGWARRDADPIALRACLEDRGTRGSAQLWCRAGADVQRAAELWGRAQLLARRDLAPPPVALLARGDEVRLWWRRSDGDFLASDAPEGSWDPALRSLRRRLLALGALGPLEAGSVALSPAAGGLRARLLDPAAFAPGRSGSDPH